jgi:hypothetical protein
MSWNYRVIKHTEDGTSWHAVHEVYYDVHGNPDTWTVEPTTPYGEDKDELWRDMLHFVDAFMKPVLTLHIEEDGEEWLD